MQQGDKVGKTTEGWLGYITWVNEKKGNCGVVYTSPKDYVGGANVFDISELKVVGRVRPEEMNRIDAMSVEDLRKEVHELRHQRRRPLGVRKRVKSKEQILAGKLSKLTPEQLDKYLAGAK